MEQTRTVCSIFFCRSGNGNYQVFLDGAESGSFSADGIFNRHDAGLLRLRFTQLDICSAAQSVRYADVRFRTGSGLLLSRQHYRFAQRLQIYQQSRQHTGLFGLYLPALGSSSAARFYRQPVFVAVSAFWRRILHRHHQPVSGKLA